MLDDLRTALAAYQPRRLTRPRRAAVLVPLVEAQDGWRVLLTRRTDTLSRHKGQVAFPGGHVDPGESVVQAALREAFEEVALPPDAAEILGSLDDIPNMYNDTAVTPVVARILGAPPLQPNPAEVARIFDVPLQRLAAPEGWRHSTTDWNGRPYPLYFYDWDGETLWGLSAYVTLQVLGMTRLGSPFELPKVEY